MNSEGRPGGQAAVAVRRSARVSRPDFGSFFRLRFEPGGRLSKELFAALSAANPDLRLERTANGELEVMSPAGSEGSGRNSELTFQLVRWTKHKGRGRGRCFDSSGGFVLPNGAIRSPDASWVVRSRWDALAPEERESFAPLCPDFVVELRSESDELPKLRKKLREYIEQGALLGWLIDPLTGKVEIDRPGRRVELLARPATLSGEDVLPGFVLDLRPVFED